MGSKNKNAARPVEQEPQSGTVEVSTEEKPAVDKRALFEAYDASESDLQAAEAALDAASQRRSDAVKAIAVHCGNGPFSWKGVELSVTTRTVKQPAADGSGDVEVSRYFFKKTRKAVQVI